MSGKRHQSEERRAKQGATAGACLDAEILARRFHETYERLAPSFGYTTRPETAVPWEQVPAPNRQLMVAVCEELLHELCGACAGSDRPARD
jgi:hypothetical protein